MAYDFQQFTQKADKTLQHIREDISSLRTGRATTQLLDPVQVEAYGTMMKVHELANLSTPDPSLLVVAPWDKSILGNIEKAIMSSGLNLQPVVDGAIIRIAVPPLTEERRKEMVKLLSQKIQNGHVMLRNVRTDIKKEVEKLVDEAGVSEDDIKADLAELDKLVKEYTAKIDQMSADKEKELMTV
jgi:ribosome recycling factor